MLPHLVCIPIICILPITHRLFFQSLLVGDFCWRSLSNTSIPSFASLHSPNWSSLLAPLSGACVTMLHSARADTSSASEKLLVVACTGIHSTTLVLGLYVRTWPSKMRPHAKQINPLLGLLQEVWLVPTLQLAPACSQHVQSDMACWEQKMLGARPVCPRLSLRTVWPVHPGKRLCLYRCLHPSGTGHPLGGHSNSSWCSFQHPVHLSCQWKPPPVARPRCLLGGRRPWNGSFV